MIGSWIKHDTLDPEALEIFNQAFPNNIGVEYTVIAPYYTQLVHGTNYIFTLISKVIEPIAQEKIKFGITHKNSQNEGNKVQKGEILDELPLHVNLAYDFFLDKRFPIGGWEFHEYLDPNALNIFEKAKPKPIGYNYTVIAPYYRQKVSGDNYVFFAVGAPVTPDAEPKTLYAFKTYVTTEGTIVPAVIIGKVNVLESETT